VATAQKKAQPATHVSVWIGLGLSIVGLLIAMYAYSGTRVYDITYAYVAMAGGVVALGGILVSAWGRAIMAARAQRMRRQTLQHDALKLTEVGIAEARPPPTVAEPPQKKRFSFSLPSRRPKTEAPAVEGGASSGTLFAFRARAPPPVAPEAEPAPAAETRAMEIPAIESLVETPLAIDAPAAVPQALERVTLRCPSCSTQFTTEGVRPLAVTCPSCGFSATV
jgi:hypothetical protein